MLKRLLSLSMFWVILLMANLVNPSPLNGKQIAATADSISLSPRQPAVQVKHLAGKPKIDGKVDRQTDNNWVPVTRLTSDGDKADIAGWYRLGWTEEGLYIAAISSDAAPDRLMNTGRTPDAPLELTVHLDIQPESKPGYPGRYELRFMPLVEEPSKMLYRNQGFLFNHRLGYASQLNDEGLVVWGERTLSGIKPEGLQTRWGRLSESDAGLPGGLEQVESKNKGVVLEIFIPWNNLEGADHPTQTGVYYNLEMDLPQKSTAGWATELHKVRDTGGRLLLLEPNEKVSRDVYLEKTLLLRSGGNVVRDQQSLQVFYPASKESIENLTFELVDVSDQQRVNTKGKYVERQSLYAGTLQIPDITDGLYTLRVKSNDNILNTKPVYAATERVKQIEGRIGSLEEQRRNLKEKDVSWKTGQLARAAWLTDQAALQYPLEHQQINTSLHKLEKAGEILEAVSVDRRPDPAEVNYFRPGGFAADGQRGYVEFEAVNNGEASLTVHGDKRRDWRVDPLIYGTFSEPVIFDRPIYDLLYGQLLRNPSFEWGHPTFQQTLQQYVHRYDEIDEASARQVRQGNWVPIITSDEDEVAAPWIGIGNGEADFRISNVALNTKQSQRIRIRDDQSWAGVAQLTSMPVWRENEYHLKTYLRTAEDASPAAVELQVYQDGEIIHTSRFGEITAQWKPYTAKFTVPKSREEQNGYLVALGTKGPADIYVDQTNLFPADTVGGGLDPQSVDQIKKLNTGWVRWPGGNYASSYHWHEGVGPLTERITRPNPTWIGLNSHYFGMDEYMKFNKLADLEPLVTVNAGTGTPGEAARWVEYANGSTETPMGALRAENGHPDPYNVKYWNIGNELWGFWQAGYCTPSEYVERYQNFTETMSRTDAGLEFISIGVGPFSVGTKRWTDMLIEQVDQRHDIIDFHTYIGVPGYMDLNQKESLNALIGIPVAFEQGLMAFRDRAVAVGQKDLDVIVGEYNNSTDGRMPEQWEEVGDLLTYAGWLHGFIRQGEYVVGANATEYSIFDPRAGEFGGIHPRYELFRTYSQHAGDQPVAATLKTPVRQSLISGGKDVTPIFNLPLLDAVVLRDSTSGALSIGLINRDLENHHSVQLNLEDFNPQKKATKYLIWDEGAIRSTNDREGNTRVTEQSIEAGRNFNTRLPPHSVTLIKLYPAK